MAFKRRKTSLNLKTASLEKLQKYLAEVQARILHHTNNGYAPFSNYGAKSLEEYYKLRYENSAEGRHAIAEGRRAIKATENIFPAIACGDVKGVQALIQKGANLAACNADGLTPLQWAEKCGKDDIVNILKHP